MSNLILDNHDGKVIDFLKDTFSTDYKDDINNIIFLIVTAYIDEIAFSELDDELSSIEELNILLGDSNYIDSRLEKDRGEKSFLLSDRNLTIKKQLNQRASYKVMEKLLNKSNVKIKTLKEGRLLHGKAYIFNFNNKIEKTALLGSSNFTGAGLGITKNNNFELNTIIDSKDTINELVSWYKNIFENESEDVKEQIIKSLQELYRYRSPNEVYLKTMFEIFHKELDKTIELDKNIKDTLVYKKLYKYQRQALGRLLYNLKNYKVAFLCDSVGLGKTYVAIAIMMKYKKVLVLAPKKLLSNWNGLLKNNDSTFLDESEHIDIMAHTEIVTDKYENFSFKKYDLVVIDESHNFRNTGKKDDSRYNKLKKRVFKDSKELLLLSATPVNNSFNDLKHQIELISSKDDYFKDIKGMNIDSMQGVFKETTAVLKNSNGDISKLPENIKKIMRELIVARSRKDIVASGDTTINFPKREKPENINYEVLSSCNDYEYLASKIEECRFAIYSSFSYVKEEIKDSYRVDGERMTQENRDIYVVSLMKTLLLKRLESSISSFNISLGNIIKKLNNVINSKVLDENIEEDEDSEDFKPLEEIGKRNIRLEDLKDEFFIALKQDLEILKEIKEKTEVITAIKDKKLKRLKKIVVREVKAKGKVLIFTAYSDTAKYLYENMQKLNNNSALVTGNECSNNIGISNDIDNILKHFSPIAKEVKVTKEIEILIATDCISEGQNLQDCSVIINYDIHWNPVRLIQRYGRIDRIGSKNKTIKAINFWVSDNLDTYLEIRAKINSKFKQVEIASNEEEYVIDDKEKTLIKDLKENMKSLDEVNNSVNISDFSFTPFLADLEEEKDKNLAGIPLGVSSVVKAKNENNRGYIFCLRYKKELKEKNKLTQIDPYFLIYIKDNGELLYSVKSIDKVLLAYKELCYGKVVDETLEQEFKGETNGYSELSKYSELIGKSVEQIENSLIVKSSTTSKKRGGNIDLNVLTKNDVVDNDDFELITWLIVR